jgi:hypothetical protein
MEGNMEPTVETDTFEAELRQLARESTATPSSVEADLRKIAKVGRGTRDLILIAALVCVAGLIALVAGGFRSGGSNVSRGAEAITAPIPPAAWHVPTPPAKP